MAISVFDLFKIGIGPSSSHTVGPMRAAFAFLQHLGPMLAEVARLTATAYGSLAWTGKGHATDKALILGLAGFRPDDIDPDLADAAMAGIVADRRLTLPAPSPKAKAGETVRSVQPMGSLFEQAVLLFLDAVILELMARRGVVSEEMFTRHANLE